VWDGRVVEDGNLQKAISALRKALQAEGGADTMIVTVPGRGFRFAVPVAFEPELVAAAQLHSFGSGDDVAPLAPARPPRLWWGPAAVGTALVAVAVAVVGISVWHYTDRQAVFAPPRTRLLSWRSPT